MGVCDTQLSDKPISWAASGFKLDHVSLDGKILERPRNGSR